MTSYTDSLYSGLDFSKSKAMNNSMAYNEEGEEEDDGGDDSLKIPITSSSSSKELFVEIFPEEMSSISPSTLITVLKDESAPMSTWTDAAVLYAQCGKARDGLFMLQEACSMESVLRGDKNDRVRLLASTGIAHLSQMKGGGGIGSSGNTTKSSSGGSAVVATTTAAEQALGDNLENKAMADDRFTQATRMDQLYPMTWVGKGMLNAFNGRLDQARYFFDTTLKHVGPVLPALLGLASVEFYEKNYQKALKLYGTAMQLFPSSKRYSASIRVGFGLCCYKLGQVDRARAAFQRAHEMDPQNVEAMTYVAVLSLNALGDCNFSSSATKQEEIYLQQQEEAIKLLSVAHLLDRNNATVQLRLADHYFWKWEFVSGVKVSISSSSPKVMVTTVPLHLEPGERIRIGTDFETVVSQPSSSVSAVAEEEAEQVGGRTSFTLRDAWPYESAGKGF
jgi:RNA polymerase-associated protein CTR9